MINKTILLLPGDGIGPEVINQARKVIIALEEKGHSVDIKTALIGGAAYDEEGTPLPQRTLALARSSHAILMGAVGGPQYENLKKTLLPETGLLTLRKELNLFANLRPVRVYPELEVASTLKPEVVAGLDLMIVRELTSGIYFGQPRGLSVRDNGKERFAINTMMYTDSEIERIARFAFETAIKRQKKLSSIDKANVLEVSQLWREVVNRVAADYPEVAVSHMYVDNAAMQLVRNPKQFDVILASNLFGDILSDLAAMLSGSIGMLPSASLNGKSRGLYEPIHGSAPDIAGTGKANPLAAILSLAMLFRYSLNNASAANRIEIAVKKVLSQARTDDLNLNVPLVSTEEMGDKIAELIVSNDLEQ